MNLRVAILVLAGKHNLSPDAGLRLKQLAMLDSPPPSLLRYLPFGLAVLSAVLVGLGIVFWVAANWDALPRSLRFILIEAIVLATLVGAWLMLGGALERGVLCYVVGVLFLYGAVHLSRSGTVSPFVEQLGLPVLLVGGALLVYGLFRDLPDVEAEALLLLVIVGTAWLVPQHWLRVLLGALAAMVFILMSTNHQNSDELNIWGGTLMALVLWLIGVCFADTHAPSSQSARKMILLETMSNGWILLTLAALVYDSGATFLSPAALRHLNDAGESMGSRYALSKVVSSLLTIAGAAWLGRCWPALRATCYAAAAAILAILSWLISGLGAALLVLSACIGSGRWRLAVAGAVAASWIVGTFYYQLDVSLATKAGTMAAMGAAFGVIAWLSWSASAREVAVTAVPAPTPATTPALRAGIAASLLLTLMVANGAIQQKEALISTGKPIFIALAPVDPRSLMQGDYMALNFQMPALDREEIGALRRAMVIAKVDGRGVAVMQGLAGGTSLAQDEILIELVQTGSGLRPATNAWYFKEGEARRQARAKYGEFRIDDKGRALLVNLRGPDLEQL